MNSLCKWIYSTVSQTQNYKKLSFSEIHRAFVKFKDLTGSIQQMETDVLINNYLVLVIQQDGQAKGSTSEAFIGGKSIFKCSLFSWPHILVVLSCCVLEIKTTNSCLTLNLRYHLILQQFFVHFTCDTVGIFTHILNEEVVVLGISEGTLEWLHGEGLLSFIGEPNQKPDGMASRQI